MSLALTTDEDEQKKRLQPNPLYGASKAGPAGAAAGLVAPELMANPSVQMGLARGLNWTGKGLQYTPATVPLTGAGKGLTNSLMRYEQARQERERRGQ